MWILVLIIGIVFGASGALALRALYINCQVPKTLSVYSRALEKSRLISYSPVDDYVDFYHKLQAAFPGMTIRPITYTYFDKGLMSKSALKWSNLEPEHYPFFNRQARRGFVSLVTIR